MRLVPFKIDIHVDERVLEIVYPKEVAAADVVAYLKRCRELILMLGGRWSCLVDQTANPILPPALVNDIASLNAFASEHGMQRCARILSSEIGKLQARRMAREVKGNVVIQTFDTRDEAWKWIRKETDASASKG
jgi:hypothetical protein